MAEDERDADEQVDVGQDAGLERDRDAALDAAEQDDTVSSDKKCPECGEPVHNLRATCPNCGYEYQDSDRDDPAAGQDFVAGSEVEEGDRSNGTSSGGGEDDAAGARDGDGR